MVAALAPICLVQFQHASDATVKLGEIKKISSYNRADFVEKAGWATMPGTRRPVPEWQGLRGADRQPELIGLIAVRRKSKTSRAIRPYPTARHERNMQMRVEAQPMEEPKKKAGQIRRNSSPIPPMNDL